MPKSTVGKAPARSPKAAGGGHSPAKSTARPSAAKSPPRGTKAPARAPARPSAKPPARAPAPATPTKAAPRAAPARSPIRSAPAPVKTRGGARVAPARAPAIKAGTGRDIQRGLAKIAKAQTRAAVSRATGVAPSTLRRWEQKPPKGAGRERAAKALTAANKRLYVSQKETKALARDLQQAQRLGKERATAAANRRDPRTIDRTIRNLTKKPTRKEADKARRLIAEMDKAAQKVEIKRIATKDKAGNIVKVRGQRTVYKGAVRPPRKASAYRIFGLDKKGKSIWSTLQGADYNAILSDADKKREKYKTAEIRIELIDLYDDYGSPAESGLELEEWASEIESATLGDISAADLMSLYSESEE